MAPYDQIAAFTSWVGVARRYGEASQSFVGRSTDLATASRDLAAGLDDGPGTVAAPETDSVLAGDLRTLATTIEEGARRQRDDYLRIADALESLDSIDGPPKP